METIKQKLESLCSLWRERQKNTDRSEFGYKSAIGEYLYEMKNLLESEDFQIAVISQAHDYIEEYYASMEADKHSKKAV